MSTIEIGDVVRLKSDGPNMTVTAIKGDTATCQWFILEILNTGEFTLAGLERVPEPRPTGQPDRLESTMPDRTPGDFVRLKLGGPKMIVKGTEGDVATCQWFDKEDKLHEHTEPPRVYRRLFSLSQAALADFPSCR